MGLYFGRRRKITLLFLMGVGLPSLGLTYLAFRGIRNDLALREQQALEELRTAATRVTAVMEGQIAASESAFSQALAAYPTLSGVGARSTPSPEMLSRLGGLKGQHPLVDQVVFIDAPGTIELPLAKLLFLPDGAVQRSPPPRMPASAAEAVAAAQVMEFRQQRFAQALAAYERALEGVTAVEARGELLLAISRVRRKTGSLHAAMDVCETLRRDYGQVRTAAGILLGPTASLELGSLQLAAGDTLGALVTDFEFYRRLVDGEWTLERAQFDFMTAEVRTAITSLLSRMPSVDPGGTHERAFTALTEEEGRRRARTERLLTFRERAGPELYSRRTGEVGSEVGAGRRFTLDTGGELYLISLLRPDQGDPRSWALVLDADYLRDGVLGPVLEEHAAAAGAAWVVRGTDGGVILASEEPRAGSSTLTAGFSRSFPPWLLELHEERPSPYRLLFLSSQSIYFYMFLLIATILAFGLILTTRAVSHELELARMKSDFVSTVSHEFKSPLTSIRQLAEMLQAGRVPSEERRNEYYAILVEQSSRLSTLIANILDLARMEEGKKEFRFEEVEVGSLLEEVLSGARHRVVHAGFEIQAIVDDNLPKVRADKEAISRALSNLLDNAVKYSGEGRAVNVRAFVCEGWLSIAVEDFGVGIPTEELDRVFDRFYRGGDALTRSVKGSGLGLTLVKQVVEAHGGEVQAESAPGRGSTFTIRLPIGEEDSRA